MANTAVAELEPKHLWKRFYEITQVPRPSKKEEKILALSTELLWLVPILTFPSTILIVARFVEVSTNPGISWLIEITP